MNRDLHLDDGSTIKWFARSYEDFLNKTTLIYGRTQSGKSTIVLEIMKLLKDHIAIPFVVSQSNGADFIGKIPHNCIKPNITKEWLEDFLFAQKGRAQLYNTANNMENLKSLFDRIKTSELEGIEQKCNKIAARAIQDIERSETFDYSKKREKIKYVQDMQRKALVELYKSNIRLNKYILDGSVNMLSPDEICCLNYLDFLPNALLIFDDCASVFKKWAKDSTVIKEIFYAGRWSYITFIITSQDDKEIESELRKNAIVSFFTTSQAATANFTRSSNSYSKEEKKRADLCAHRIFNSSGADSKRNFKKLVYVQNREDPFMYMIADIQEDFKMGCPALWDIDKKIEETKNSNNSEELHNFFNRYYLI